MKSHAAGAFATLCALSVFPAAAAESVGIVAVAEPPGPSAELAELTHQLRLVATERTQGVVDANELRQRMTGQSSSATLAELDRAYAGALATYQNGDFEGAVRTLSAVVQDLERLPPGAEAFSQWTRAMLRLARAEQTLGRGGEAREVMERLVRANPAVKVDAYQYPPSFAKQIEDVKAQVRKLAKKKLTIDSTAKGAKIFLEGREVGTSPITLELPPGRYRVAGALGNARVPAMTVDLTEEGQTVVLNFALAESLRPGFGPGLALTEAERPRNLVAAGAWLGVDKLLVSRLVAERGVEYLSATMIDVRRGMFMREGRVRLSNKVAPAGSLSALVGFLITGQTSDLVSQVAVSPSQAAPSQAAPSQAAPSQAAPSQAAPEPAPAPEKAAPAKPEKKAEAKLAAAPKPDEKKAGVDFRAAPPPSGKSKTKGWAAVGLGVAAVGLGGLAIVEGLSANSKYSDANDMAPGGILRPGVTSSQYEKIVSDGDNAKTIGAVSGGAAAACLVGAGILGYLSYKQTGEIGPFRF